MFVVFDELVGEAGFKLGAAELSSVGTNVFELGVTDGEVVFVVFDELVGEAGFKLGAAELSSVGTNVSGLGTGDGEVGAIELGV